MPQTLNCRKKSEEKEITEEVNDIPTTAQEAFAQLDALLDEEDKKRLVEDEIAIINAHFSLGMWIRNNWIYADKEGKGLFAYDSDHPGIIDPDYQSAEFLEKYYNHLKRKQRA